VTKWDIIVTLWALQVGKDFMLHTLHFYVYKSFSVCCQVIEHAANCPGTEHKNARSHFVCRAFDGHRFQLLTEDIKAGAETILTSRSGRKVRMSAAARAVLRSNSCYDDVESPTVTTYREQHKSKG